MGEREKTDGVVEQPLSPSALPLMGEREKNEPAPPARSRDGEANPRPHQRERVAAQRPGEGQRCLTHAAPGA
jgi:hypothetical protein